MNLNDTMTQYTMQLSRVSVHSITAGGGLNHLTRRYELTTNRPGLSDLTLRWPCLVSFQAWFQARASCFRALSVTSLYTHAVCAHGAAHLYAWPHARQAAPVTTAWHPELHGSAVSLEYALATLARSAAICSEVTHL